jgi:hypothetical protein
VTTEHTCVGRIWGGFSYYSCGKKAKHEHEGKWYCKTHHPPTVQAKTDARNERWEKQFAEQRERIAQQEAQRAEQKRRADLYPELLEALKAILAAQSEFEEWEAQQAARVVVAKAEEVQS